MKLIKKSFDIINNLNINKSVKMKSELLNYLKELQNLEAKLWGINLLRLSNGEEKVLEDANHLIYLLTKNKNDKLKEILASKDVTEFIMDIQKLKDDFKFLKKKIHEREKLKNLITEFTIKQVNHDNYMVFEDIFILEKQLYEVLDFQEKEFDKLFDDISYLKKVYPANENLTIDEYISMLRKIREILSGHMDFHSLWDEERKGYSNISNILHSIISLVKNI